jgi:hypothetical protein
MGFNAEQLGTIKSPQFLPRAMLGRQGAIMPAKLWPANFGIVGYGGQQLVAMQQTL